MRLLITGGTGLLGSTLVQHAREQGMTIAASHYSQSPPTLLCEEVAWHRLDIRESRAVEAVVEAFRPAVIIHTAFRQNDPELHAVTAEGSRHVAIAAARTGSRLIHLSSDVIFDGERESAYTEDDVPNPITAYGRAKADAEQLVWQQGAEVVIVRTSLIYDFPRIDRHTQFVLEMLDGRHPQAKLFTDEYRCPILATDLARAILELAKHPYRGILNIAGADVVSRYDFGVLLAQAHGRDAMALAAGSSLESSAPRPRNCALDSQRARSLLTTPLRGVREVPGFRG